MEENGLVSVICIAYNHEKWIEEALESVFLQTYASKELIIVDNGSSDQTAIIIRDWVTKHSKEISISPTYKSVSQPYCELFNEMLSQANGEFVVDLSGDDFFYPAHLSLSVERLKQKPETAFVFSNATISEKNGTVKEYYKEEDVKDLKGKTLGREFYQTLIFRSYISSPTVVFRSRILKHEGGYDELLSYEDFDIQLRLTSKYPVVFSEHVGVFKRKHAHSLSAHQYRRYQSEMLPSTLLVCKKIKEMNRSVSEDAALEKRILFELKHALYSANFDCAEGYVSLANELKLKALKFQIYKLWIRFRLDISWFYAKLT